MSVHVPLKLNMLRKSNNMPGWLSILLFFSQVKKNHYFMSTNVRFYLSYDAKIILK